MGIFRKTNYAARKHERVKSRIETKYANCWDSFNMSKNFDAKRYYFNK